MLFLNLIFIFLHIFSSTIFPFCYFFPCVFSQNFQKPNITFMNPVHILGEKNGKREKKELKRITVWEASSSSTPSCYYLQARNLKMHELIFQNSTEWWNTILKKFGTYSFLILHLLGICTRLEIYNMWKSKSNEIHNDS